LRMFASPVNKFLSGLLCNRKVPPSGKPLLTRIR
jgi:hypothetical protein